MSDFDPFAIFDANEPLQTTADVNPHKAIAKEAAKPTFPCMSCAGTGRWRGGVNQQGETKCFACLGRGYFKTSHADRQQRKAKAAASKAKRIEDTRAAFNEAHPGLVQRMEKHSWSDFIREMLTRYNDGQALSENQVAAIIRSCDKADARDEQRRVEREQAVSANSGEVDLSRIVALFDTARGNGLQKPKFRIEGLEISRAADTGRNPGALYVTNGEAYYGKILGGKFQAVRDTPAGTIDRLRELSADPLAVGVAYGRRTGACCACGRTLTDHQSIANGIGPICQEKWGLGDNAVPTTNELFGIEPAPAPVVKKAVAPAPAGTTKKGRVAELARRPEGVTIEQVCADLAISPAAARGLIGDLRRANIDIRAEQGVFRITE